MAITTHARQPFLIASVKSVLSRLVTTQHWENEHFVQAIKSKIYPVRARETRSIKGEIIRILRTLLKRVASRARAYCAENQFSTRARRQPVVDSKTGFFSTQESVRSSVRSKTALFMVRQNYWTLGAWWGGGVSKLCANTGQDRAQVIFLHRQNRVLKFAQNSP